MANRANRARELGPGVGSAARNTDNAYFVDNGDGTFDQTEAARVYIKVGGVWQAWDGSVTGGGGGGGAATIADGADVAQGATTDLSSASTIVGILKAIKAAITGTLAVSGTFWQATQPVSIASMPSTPVTGPVTDTQLRASAVPVSLASAPTTAVTGPLTDTQLRATAVPVSGTVTASGPVTDTQLRASAVPVSLATVPSHAVTTVDGGDVTVGALADAAYVSGSGSLVSILKGIFTKLSGSLAVTGTFFQATQPVSLATNTPDVTDRTGRLLGHVTVDSAPTTAITAAALPLPAGAATSANQSTLKAASTIAAATDTASVVQQSPQRADAASLCVTNTAATGVACTLTIPAAAAGLFHYICLIEIQLYATTARTGGASPVLVTTTNLPGSPVWDFDTAQALGVTIRQTTQPATPIKSSVAATNTTIVAPIATTGIWRITAYYYTAP